MNRASESMSFRAGAYTRPFTRATNVQPKFMPRAATLAQADRLQSNETPGRKQDGARVILNGSDDNGNVLQGQEALLETNRHWHNTAFPQYLQSEKDDFCEEWDKALQSAERTKSSQAGQTAHRSVSPDNPIWQAVVKEAARDASKEPLLSSFLYASILSHDNFQDCLAFVLANRLSTPTLLATECYELFQSVFREDDGIVQAALADLAAVRERDPSCYSYSNALLFYKGYHAIQVHRTAHHLWEMGLEVSARALQARVSEVFAMDIHPQAKFGKGILMDHGTGVVVGQTAEIGNNVSILQNVTLGGTGKEHGDRHPKVCDNVLIGAAATILGNIIIGKGAMVAAGSLVLKSVPPKVMVAGSPAKEIGKIQGNPALKMQHWLKTTNVDCDQSGDFETMIRHKSEEASQQSNRNNGSNGSQSDSEAQADSKYEDRDEENPNGSNLLKTEASKDSVGNTDLDEKQQQQQSQQGKAESQVMSVRSDLAAQRLWPEPEEPEYYL